MEGKESELERSKNKKERKKFQQCYLDGVSIKWLIHRGRYLLPSSVFSLFRFRTLMLTVRPISQQWDFCEKHTHVPTVSTQKVSKGNKTEKGKTN